MVPAHGCFLDEDWNLGCQRTTGVNPLIRAGDVAKQLGHAGQPHRVLTRFRHPDQAGAVIGRDHQHIALAQQFTAVFKVVVADDVGQ